MTEPPRWTGPVLSYFDPERPQTGVDRPSLLRTSGLPWNVVIPALSLTPNPDGSLTLWGFFPMDGQSSAPRFATFPDWPSLADAYARWLACPERFAMEELGWTPREGIAIAVSDFRAKPLRPAPQELSLDDLM